MTSSVLPLRLAVESIILHKSRILLVKRSPLSKVAPSVWNVPAGKVNYLEVTRDAVIRETEEETSLKVNVIRLLNESAFTIQSGTETVYRNMFTYLTSPLLEDPQVKLNEEHTEYVWVNKSELRDEKFNSLNDRIKKLIDELL